MPQNAVWVQLRLRKNLRLCGKNETDADCCPKPLCVLETLQVSACVGGTPRASLLIQAEIHARLVPANAGAGDSNETSAISNAPFKHVSTVLISCPFQVIKQSFQTKCTSPWALVPVTSHSELVIYAAAVTRYLHL